VTTKVADGIACRTPDEEALEIILSNVERIEQVSDEQVEAAMKIYFTDTHNVAEGAGAVGLAAALSETAQIQGKRVGLVLTGGNVDHDVFARILQRGPAVDGPVNRH
jgi:threonine dehydratase